MYMLQVMLMGKEAIENVQTDQLALQSYNQLVALHDDDVKDMQAKIEKLSLEKQAEIDQYDDAYTVSVAKSIAIYFLKQRVCHLYIYSICRSSKNNFSKTKRFCAVSVQAYFSRINWRLWSRRTTQR